MYSADNSGWERHDLRAGTLHLRLPKGSGADLFKIAERLNPKRAFLFVSTVLGRHIPVAPARHRAALRHLADAVAGMLGDGPVMVMGYAETAVGLGAGICQELRRARPGRPISYLPTTRFEPGEAAVWFRLREPHSHAAEHSVLYPETGVLPDDPDATLVLVDDETTTGTTFFNLATALAEAWAPSARIVLVTLTDWSEGAAAARVAAALPETEVRMAALLSGGWHWAPDSAYTPTPLPSGLSADAPLWRPSTDAPLGAPRFGIAAYEPLGLPQDLTARLLADAGLGDAPAGRRVLVIGSGEHVWQPFLAAEHLAAAGHDVRMVATTRSPILEGEVIARKIVFPDHYGLGLPMYLHNVDPAAWDAILLFNETGEGGTSPVLLRALGRGVLFDAAGRARPFFPPHMEEVT